MQLKLNIGTVLLRSLRIESGTIICQCRSSGVCYTPLVAVLILVLSVLLLELGQYADADQLPAAPLHDNSISNCHYMDSNPGNVQWKRQQKINYIDSNGNKNDSCDGDGEYETRKKLKSLVVDRTGELKLRWTTMKITDKVNNTLSLGRANTNRAAKRKIEMESSPRTMPYPSSAKPYLPRSFVNPFGQLVAFFGGDQLDLQDYNFLFNAERHTLFHLHTNVQTSNPTPISVLPRDNASTTRVLHTMFGNKHPEPTPANRVHIDEVRLYNATSLRQSRFNPFNPTRILVHGWLGGAKANVYTTLVPTYLRQGIGNYNIITVDWGRGAIADYVTASYRVTPVGKVLAKFVDFLHSEAGLRFEDLHVVGFSMGAHVAGIAGKVVKSGRFAVIYALDPALPFFPYENIEHRLSVADADYVEVLHTSIGSYGYDRPLGHVDFYLNYGSAQPGCFLNECSHFRAFLVFSEALALPHLFVGQGCDVKLWRDLVRNRRCLMSTGLNMTLAGDPYNATVLKRRGGVYNLLTSAHPPYALRAR